MNAVDLVLERLERVKRSGKGWISRCPAHDDRDPSLSIAEADDGAVLLCCHAGCTVEAVVAALGLDMRDLFPEGEGGESTPPKRRQVDQVDQVGHQGVRLATVDGKPVDPAGGLTVEQLAVAKRLPVDLLVQLGCETVRYFGPPAVLIPYADEAGMIVGARYRLALAGDARFRWKKGTKASVLLYGASRLYEARDAGYVIACEGESDAWTLLHHGFPAVALPGADMWNEEHVPRLDGIETIYVVIEPDKGGETLLDALSRSAMRPRVRVVRLPVKDASELHLQDEAAFEERFKAAMEVASTLPVLEEEARREQAAEAWAICADLAHEPDILDAFALELRARGFVGPLTTPKLIYLVLVSRRLRRPVSLVLRGLSSAGKSYNVESVLPFFPRSSYFDRSGMSERALIYSEESFEHRILYIAEADGIAGDVGAYFLRTLISENRLVYETVEKDGAGRLVARTIRKPGPCGVLLTTTRLRLDPQNETRMLALTVPDDPGLTREIMRAIALRDDDSDESHAPEVWPALQSWLELGGERRVTDEGGFLLALANLVPVVAVRLRRDFSLVRSLVFAHAILHQANRSRDEAGRIVATLDDYSAVRELIASIVAEGIGATVSNDVRQTVAAVEAAIAEVEPETTVRRVQVQDELGLDGRATGRRLAQAVDAGYVENTNPGRGKVGLYKPGLPIPGDIDVLPTAAEIRHHLDNLDNLAGDPGDGRPPPLEEWLARDGVWRSLAGEPPAFPDEVVATRYDEPAT